MSDCLRCPVCSCAHSSTHCARDLGCSAHPAFPAPSDFERSRKYLQTSGGSRRENAKVYLPSLRAQRSNPCCRTKKEWIGPPPNQWTPVVGLDSQEVSNVQTTTAILFGREQAAGC